MLLVYDFYEMHIVSLYCSLQIIIIFFWENDSRIYIQVFCNLFNFFLALSQLHFIFSVKKIELYIFCPKISFYIKKKKYRYMIYTLIICIYYAASFSFYIKLHMLNMNMKSIKKLSMTLFWMSSSWSCNTWLHPGMLTLLIF